MSSIDKFCRWAPSLGELEETAEYIWSTLPYEYFYASTKPTVFFGLYDLRDYIALRRHKGKKWILWCGSDLMNLKNKFLFNDGKLKWLSKKFLWFHATVLNEVKKAENWVENETEAEVLRAMDITPFICPSFLGKVNNFRVTYKSSQNPRVYVSSSIGHQKDYGFEIVDRIAPKVPHMAFYLYGDTWRPKSLNVVCRGRVSKQTMNEEIKSMQAGLRFHEFEGCSEILVKSVLYGQYPIVKVKHPYIDSFNNENELIDLLKKLPDKKEPNYKVREWYIANLNRYPWVNK